HLTRKAHEMRSGFIRAQKFIKYTKLANDSNKKTPNGSAPSTTTAATTTNIASGSPNAGSGSGQIVFDHVFARYSSDSQLALGDMSFAINPGQHVGIVGRTGSGKTSIVMALFGLLQSERGSITIDSIDISSLDAQTLRAKLSIVPQTPTMLLPGTIRDNLDPLNKCTNEDIKQALAKVGLEQQVDIDMPVTSSTRWSIGELQLLCLARALLQRTDILVLDEATAAIDGLTSRNLHRVIQQEFASCTVITIAHRVESVLHNDLVMVVEDGRICEAGRPADLCSIPNGYFATLVKRSMGTCDVIDGEKTEAMEPATCPPTPP
ncbi:Multidrug resistance-associated protein 5, partial [Dipsacomyces acuminosporus]